MKKRKGLQKKLFLVLVSAIILICAGFIFISCGTSPQLKITDPDTGQFAIDFSDCPGTLCQVFVESSQFTTVSSKSVGGKELTAEAWVKMDSADDGNIVARMDSNRGVALYVKGGNPKFAIRREPTGTDPGAGGCENVHSTSTECRVDSGETFGGVLNLNTWYHIAGVLVNSDHTGVHATCGGDEAEIPHLDIYINGVFKACDSANSLFADDATQHETMTVGLLSPNVSNIANLDPDFKPTTGGITNADGLDGEVDEVRLWGVARSQAEIQACMNQELDLTSGTCGRVTSNLISYLRLNEGTGHSTTDWAGLGAGFMEMRNPGIAEFSTGWITGAPITRKD